MFCTTLRRRASFSSAIPSLVAPAGLAVRESRIETHDVQLRVYAEIDQKTGNTVAERQLRVLLLSPSSIAETKLDETITRIQRFASLIAGQDLAIIFCLAPPPASSFVSAKHVANGTAASDAIQTGGTYAFAALQAKLMERNDIPYIFILPIADLDGLVPTLKKHVASIKRSRRPVQKKAPTSFDLLHLCTANPPMPQQTAYYLSDLFPDMRTLAQACTSVTSPPGSSSPSMRAAEISSQLDDVLMGGTQGSDAGAHGKLGKLRDLVGEQQCMDVVDFWKEEWTVE